MKFDFVKSVADSVFAFVEDVKVSFMCQNVCVSAINDLLIYETLQIHREYEKNYHCQCLTHAGFLQCKI